MIVLPGLPRGFSLPWRSELLWVHIVSDALIALSQFLIPVALVRIARRRRDSRFDGLLFCMAAFITACGLTHVMDIVTLWRPVPWLSGGLKEATAAIALVSCWLLLNASGKDFSMFAKLFEFSPDAVFVTDREGRIRDSNGRANELFGYSRAELAERSIESLIPERFRKHHPDYVSEYSKNPASRPMGAGLELFGQRKDGREIAVDIMLKPVDTVEGTLILSFVRDVSEQRLVQENLRYTTGQLKSVLESTTMSVLAVDESWHIDYMNGTAKNILHVEKALDGISLWEAFPSASTGTRETLHRVMASREPAAYEDYYEPLDLWTRVKASAREQGGITIFFSDISQQKRLERELEEERGLRMQRIEVLARLSSELAHEIKNPLAIIRARASDLAEIADETPHLPAEIVTKTCGSIVSTSDRAIRILRGVAALAREGRNDPMQETGVPAMVEQAIALVRGRFARESILLEAVMPDDLPKVECREVQIEQILVNLLNNAFDAIEGDPRSERWVRVEVSTQPGKLYEDDVERLPIEVIDGGPGVPAEYKTRLMDTFFTTKPMGAGIGIGLSVSRTMAEEHGGNLELREGDDHTCFRLTLPVTAARTAEDAV